jgi:hypothetical protein
MKNTERRKPDSRVDAFGYLEKPYLETINDFEDPTPLAIHGRREKDFYQSLGLKDSDLILIRDEGTPEEVEESLTSHREVYSGDQYVVMAGENVPEEFSQLNDRMVDGIVGNSSLVDLKNSYERARNQNRGMYEY